MIIDHLLQPYTHATVHAITTSSPLHTNTQTNFTSYPYTYAEKLNSQINFTYKIISLPASYTKTNTKIKQMSITHRIKSEHTAPTSQSSPAGIAYSYDERCICMYPNEQLGRISLTNYNAAVPLPTIP